MVERSHHGNFDIKVSGNILCATLLGSWNSQTAEAFSEQFMIQAVPLMGSSWGHLVLLDDWDLGVPETVPVIEHLNKMVIEEIGVFQRNSFTQKTEAEAWLAASGFHLDTAYP